MARNYRVLCAMALRSQSAVSASCRAKEREVRLGLAFDCLQAIDKCLKIVCAQPCWESTFAQSTRTKCEASCAFSCDLIKKRASRLRFERGVGALLPYRVGQSGQGSPLRICRPHQLRFRATSRLAATLPRPPKHSPFLQRSASPQRPVTE